MISCCYLSQHFLIFSIVQYDAAYLPVHENNILTRKYILYDILKYYQFLMNSLELAHTLPSVTAKAGWPYGSLAIDLIQYPLMICLCTSSMSLMAVRWASCLDGGLGSTGYMFSLISGNLPRNV